jgi:hypothetical protein
LAHVTAAVRLLDLANLEHPNPKEKRSNAIINWQLLSLAKVAYIVFREQLNQY